MKKINFIFALITLLFSTPVFAAETVTYPGPQEAATTVYKQIMNNEHVRVSEITFAPGAKAPMHSHPYWHSIYIIEGGELTITKPDGTSTVMQAKAGDALWMGTETHEAVNTGTTTLRGTVTEIK